MKALGLMGLMMAVALVGPAGADPVPAPAPALDGVRILAPPPAPGTPLAVADRKIFERTRALRDTARWRLAQSDVKSEAFEHYACALGAQLTPDSAPLVWRLLDGASAGQVVGKVKTHYGSPRPYLRSKAPICEAKTAHLAGNPDYPSGHTAGGWVEALILAELAPDRASEILARGRAFGESRVVCGSHSVSAVQAGFMAGSAVVAALHGQPEFRRDLEEARAELAQVRATAPAPDAAGCRAEAAALKQPAY